MMKCNTDGESRGNPGSSVYGFCLTNSRGDFIYAAAENIGITTNVEAELRAILEAIKNIVLLKRDTHRDAAKSNWRSIDRLASSNTMGRSIKAVSQREGLREATEGSRARHRHYRDML
ncbi:hypothetical protein RDI58_000991 [Solanum bulbocastanum]|uniref:RNase H type-1 domain-containing protein n=1 Tax=Solanum bulbocastanum TaxID=147425 RepID=A0AAN8YSV6_SOLBU